MRTFIKRCACDFHYFPFLHISIVTIAAQFSHAGFCPSAYRSVAGELNDGPNHPQCVPLKLVAPHFFPMKKHLTHFALAAAVVALPLLGCQKSSGPNPTTFLVGSWQLTNRTCYCAPAPTPNEKIIFTPTSFSFFKNDTLRAMGTYSPGSGRTCNGTPVPVLHFTINQGTWPLHDAIYTVNTNQLILDYNTDCLADALVNTYKRLP